MRDYTVFYEQREYNYNHLADLIRFNDTHGDRSEGFIWPSPFYPNLRWRFRFKTDMKDKPTGPVQRPARITRITHLKVKR